MKKWLTKIDRIKVSIQFSLFAGLAVSLALILHLTEKLVKTIKSYNSYMNPGKWIKKIFKGAISMPSMWHQYTITVLCVMIVVITLYGL